MRGVVMGDAVTMADVQQGRTGVSRPELGPEGNSDQI